MMEHLITQASSYAARVDNLIDFIAIVVGIWFIIGQAVFFTFIFRYSRKRHPKSAYVTGETKEDGKWVHISHYAVIVCDVVILALASMTWYHVKQALPPADSTIRVVGEQWAWKFTDPGPDNQLDTPDDVTTIDELHVKVGTTYHFKLEAKDVIHSFSVPVFRLKQDAIPGRVITGWFKPTKTGEFDVQCTQMCGIGHGIMAARIIIETPEQHAAWLRDNSKTVAGVDASGEIKNIAKDK
jgi:cytochrome c oxidase subunit 2